MNNKLFKDAQEALVERAPMIKGKKMSYRRAAEYIAECTNYTPRYTTPISKLFDWEEEAAFLNDKQIPYGCIITRPYETITNVIRRAMVRIVEMGGYEEQNINVEVSFDREHYAKFLEIVKRYSSFFGDDGEDNDGASN